MYSLSIINYIVYLVLFFCFINTCKEISWQKKLQKNSPLQFITAFLLLKNFKKSVFCALKLNQLVEPTDDEFNGLFF